jgi:type III secretion protein V
MLPSLPTLWVKDSYREALRAGGIAFMEPAQVLSYHIASVLQRYADEFIGLQETRFLLSRMEDRFPELVKEVQRVVPLQKIAEILQRLVSEGVSVRNMRSVLTALIDWGQKEKDTVLLAEYVRGALKRQICYRYSSGLNIIPAYVVTPELEETVRNAIRQTSSGSYLALDPRTTRQIVDRVREATGTLSAARKPVLLTSMDVRRYLRKIIEAEFRDIAVLSYQELTTEITVQPLARISL